MLFTLTTLALLPAVLSQSTTVNVPLEIESIEAQFQYAQLVPSLIPTFDPTAALHFSFDNTTDNTVGQALTITQVADLPKLTLYATNSSIANDTSMFTLAMVDAGPVGQDESAGVTRHWLVNDLSVSGDGSPKTFNMDNATAITEFAGPYPAAGTGPHRYCILLYSQPSTFAPPANLSTPDTPLQNNWDFLGYVDSTGLGPLVAGTYYTVEQGSASSSIPAIPTVISSTLPAAMSIAAASTAGTTTGSASASPTMTAKSGARGQASAASGLFGVAVIVAFLVM